MKVYGDSISGNCHKVKYTADCLGLSYEWVEVNILERQSRTTEFLAINPAGQVPAIQLPDGSSLAQSNAIIRYLAHGSHLLPADLYAQAKIDEWLFWEQYSHEPYVAVCRFQKLYLKRQQDELEPWRVERGNEALDFMDAALSEQSFLANDRFSIADIALLAYTRLAHEGGFDLSPRRHVRRWIADCEAQVGLSTSK